jgi:hypothetical protein
VHRVITDDIFTDLLDTVWRTLTTAQRAEIQALLKLGADHVINTLFDRAMKASLATEWGVRQGMRVMGAKTPAEWLGLARRYRTDDVSPLIEQDILLLAGAEDHYVPVHQFYDQISTLTHARSLTARLFTRQEQAHDHVQVGNLGLQFRVIKDWIDEWLMQETETGSIAASSILESVSERHV